MSPRSTHPMAEQQQHQHKQHHQRLCSSDSSSDDEDLKALRRARSLAGLDASGPMTPGPSPSVSAAPTVADSDEDDEELVRSTLQRCGITELFPRPLSFIPPDASDGDEDEYELLCAIKRRFAAYDGDALGNRSENDLQKHQQVRASITSEKETSSNLLFLNETNYCKGCPDTGDSTIQNLELSGDNVSDNQTSGYIEWHHSDTRMPFKNSSFPKGAQAFIDAIKCNRSCQRLLRSKLIQIDAKLEANKKLRERIKILKDYQACCRRRVKRALSQKDPFVQLISPLKARKSKNSKANDKKVCASFYGPDENAHVANYRKALATRPIALSRENWSNEERENLKKGIKQQFQQMSFQMSLDLCSGLEGSLEDSIDLDAIMTSIADFEITPEHLKLFLPKVNWEQLRSMYVPGRSSAECEARWLNWENPLINHSQWTNTEDKNLLRILKEKGYYNWIEISSLLGTNRTPFQCLARFQRSLNTFILKREWTDDEDAQLREAVKTHGEGNWQHVAFALEGRTGTQCSNRWNKTLHPMRKREGRWSQDEDKCLKIAVMLFGPKSWNKIAQFVPGRTQVQCRERWVNSLDPSLNWGEWTQEEDSRLKEAITEFGYCWSKVAKIVPPRTDSQCRRRWKQLCPHEVPLLREAKKIRKIALISNFVDRESERPALGPNDFVPLPAMELASASENTNSLDAPRRVCSKNKRREPQEAVPVTTCDPLDGCDEGSFPRKKPWRKPRSKRKKQANPVQDTQLRMDSASIAIADDTMAVVPFQMRDSGKRQKLTPRCPGRANRFNEAIADDMMAVVPFQMGDSGKRQKLTPRRPGRANRFNEAEKAGDHVATLCDNASNWDGGVHVLVSDSRVQQEAGQVCSGMELPSGQAPEGVEDGVTLASFVRRVRRMRNGSRTHANGWIDE